MVYRSIRLKGRLLLCIFVFVFSLASTSPGLFSQKNYIRFKHISNEQGLSQVTINCILQDSKGFMWFGTQDGLNRYDGYEFKTYRHDPADETTISDNYIWCIYEDQPGTLWIGTNDGGLNKFDPKTEIFIRFKHKEGDKNGLSHNYVTSILKDRLGILWIGTKGGGLNKFDPEKDKFLHCYQNDVKEESLSDDRVMYIYEDRENTMWIGTYGGGLNKFDTETEKFTPYQHDPSDPKSLSNNKVMAICETNSGYLWIGTEDGGLNKMIDRDQGKFVKYTTGNSKLSNDKITAIFEDREGVLWIGSEGGGVNTFNQKNDQFTIHLHNAADQQSLSRNDVRSIYEDKSGVIWIGTKTGGLNRLNQGSKNFVLYQNNFIEKTSLSNNDVRSIYEDESGVLWIGTYTGGLNKLIDREKDIFKHFTTADGLSDNDIKCIHEDRTGALWIGTRDGGLNRYDPKTGKFKIYTTDNSQLSHNDVRCLLKDVSGELWIGTEGGGLNKLIDPESSQFKHYPHKENNANSLSHDIVFSLYEDRAGVLWIGTRGGGLNKMVDRKQGIFKSYTTADGLSHNFVISIHEDTTGLLWIGTFGGGLNSFDGGKNEFKSYREKDGLSNDVVYGILEDEKNNLWLSTNKGISRFNPKEKTFRNYDFNDGLQNNEFNAGAYFKSEKTGEMFFGGISGFNCFFPGKITPNNYSPQVVITDFLILNKSVKPQPQEKKTPLRFAINETEEIILSQRQNQFSFEFAAFCYGDPHNKQYKYKLEKYDKKWQLTNGRERIASYSEISPGSYVFKVKSSDEEGRWSDDDKCTSIKLKINRSFWKTWWAYTLYILVFIVFVISTWAILSKVYLTQKVKKRTNQLIQAEKNAALGTLLANVAHEINNPSGAVRNTAFSLTRDIEKLKTFLIELAGEDADDELLVTFDKKFDVLFEHLETISDSSKRVTDIVKTLRLFSRKDGEMKRMKVMEGLEATIALIKTRYKEQIEFITDIEEPVEIEGISSELNQVYMNIMENACYSMAQKHKNTGGNLKGTLTIQTRQENGRTLIRFKDTGTGISEEVQKRMFDPFFTTKPEGEGTGLGLAISYSIVEKHGGKFEVESFEGQGTVITIYLPVEQKDKIKKNKNLKTKMEGIMSKLNFFKTHILNKNVNEYPPYAIDEEKQKLIKEVDELKKQLHRKEKELQQILVNLARWQMSQYL